MPLLLQIFEIACIYLRFIQKNKIQIIQFLLIPLARLATQTGYATILKNLENLFKNAVFT